MRLRKRWGPDMLPSPRSFYDALALCAGLEVVLESVARAEIHLVAYLASLLAIYSGQSSSEWGYRFAVTPAGYPFSQDLDGALGYWIKSGRLLAHADGYVRMSDHGAEEFERLDTLSEMRRNEKFIHGACGSVLVMPVGVIREALGHEGDLQRVPHLSQAELLPTEVGSELRREQFIALRHTLPLDLEDLMTPAVVWLSYLTETSPQSRRGA